MGVIWHQWDCPRSLHAAHKCIIAYFQLDELIKRNRFELIHCHSPIGGVLARIAAHRRGITVLYTAHGFHFYRGAPLKNWLLYYPVEKLLAYWTDVLITVNKEDYAFAKRKLAAGMIYRIPGIGVDIEKFAGSGMRRKFRERYRIPQDAVLLLSVGELSRRKNHRMAIKALAELHRNDVFYMICGQGRLRRNLLHYAEKLGIDRQVRLTGYLEDAAAAYQAADIFVFPSKQEGMPAALMEAMAAGLPCVVSDIRGNRELITELEPQGTQRHAGGVLFQLEHLWELADALRNLIQDQQLRRACGSYNRQRSAQYSLAIVEKYMKMIYQRYDISACIKTEKND